MASDVERKNHQAGKVINANFDFKNKKDIKRVRILPPIKS